MFARVKKDVTEYLVSRSEIKGSQMKRRFRITKSVLYRLQTEFQIWIRSLDFFLYFKKNDNLDTIQECCSNFCHVMVQMLKMQLYFTKLLTVRCCDTFVWWHDNHYTKWTPYFHYFIPCRYISKCKENTTNCPTVCVHSKLQAFIQSN